MPDLTGKSLGRYQIIEQLGQGGMANVYKAYDTRLETEVAVKVIRTEDLPARVLERALKRFEREAKALAKLNHPNIVKVIDYGKYDGNPYLVMPYLSGGTLKHKLNGQQMPWRTAIRMLLPIARALDYAHRQGMIHRHGRDGRHTGIYGAGAGGEQERRSSRRYLCPGGGVL
jgi:serine/threonine protein kinase